LHYHILSSPLNPFCSDPIFSKAKRKPADY
jgi:hypothetical protein